MSALIPKGADAGREGDGDALAHRLVLGPAHLLLARGLAVGDRIAELERTASLRALGCDATRGGGYSLCVRRSQKLEFL